MILTLLKLLSEGGDNAILSGSCARPHFGPVFDRLLKARVLVERAPLTEWDVCNGCECGMFARPIRLDGDRFRADCPLDAAQDVILERDDLRVFVISAPNLTSEIATAGGFDEPPTQITKGLWCLGETRSRRSIYLVLNLELQDRSSLIAIIRQLCKSGSATILTAHASSAADLWLREAGLDHVRIKNVIKPANNRSGFDFDREALDGATDASELVVRVGVARIEWLGRSVTFSHQLFPVFQRLLGKAQSRNQIASGPFLEDTTGREAKDLIRELRSQLKAERFSDAESKSLIKTVRNRGYMLGVDADNILVIE